jgi:hypothetical protein
MRTIILALAGAAAIATIVPTASFAQFAVDTPVGGVRVDEPGFHRNHWRGRDRHEWHERRAYRDHDERGWRDRDVRLRRWDRDRD